MVKKLIQNEVVKYLFFGVVTTVFYILVRTLLFYFTNIASLSATLANALSILFAFFTNDYFVFSQERKGWLKRLVKFFSARIGTLLVDVGLAYFLVDLFPEIIGTFVNNNKSQVDFIVTIISQFAMVVLNYFISKYFVFKSVD